MDRAAGYVVTTVMVPCFMFVVVGYLGLWVERENFMGRLALTAFPLLILSGLAAMWNRGFPKINYTKAIDVYTGNSVTLIFLALLCKCSYLISEYDIFIFHVKIC